MAHCFEFFPKNEAYLLITKQLLQAIYASSKKGCSKINPSLVVCKNEFDKVYYLHNLFTKMNFNIYSYFSTYLDQCEFGPSL